MTADAELVDDEHDLVLRRLVVGPLATNCWVVHAVGDRRALLVDPGGEPDRLLAGVSDLDVQAVLLTHAHFDHVQALPQVSDALAVPILGSPYDAPVWAQELGYLARHGHFDAGTATRDLLAAVPTCLTPDPDQPLWNGRVQPVHDGQQLAVGSLTATVVHTPGHTPGGLTLSLPGHLLTGDTLFPGGPGLTGWPLSDFPTIITSARRLLAAPAATAIHPGHGHDTTVGNERPHVDAWEQRGW